MSTPLPNADDFLAELRFLSAQEGGRTNAALSGYRPALKFSFSSFLTSGRQTYLETECVNPGDTVTAYIKILSVEVFKNSLQEGTEFQFLEPPRVIGYGKILKVLNPTLRKK